LLGNVGFEVEEELSIAIIIIIIFGFKFLTKFIKLWLLPLIPHNYDKWKVSLLEHHIIYKWMKRRRVIIISRCWKQRI
jgi:hypothetical protein